MNSLTEYFGTSSPLVSLLPGFQPRNGQAWMAQAVSDAINSYENLVIEAGTGTGKTFAYLLPALLSNRKIIISTGTKALQDQLYHRDLPLLSKTIGRPMTTALLKGRSNYLCLYRLDLTDVNGVKLKKDLKFVKEWRHKTISGDCSELADVNENSAIWPLVTSTVDNCLGQKCPLFDECHVVNARRLAQKADLVVINHHLLLADLAMKDDGFIEFLPGADAVILDEAHQIPDLATQFFGVSIGSRQLELLLDELSLEIIPINQYELQNLLDISQTTLRQLKATVPQREGRYDLDEIIDDVSGSITDLCFAFTNLQNAIAIFKETSDNISKIHEQLINFSERLSSISNQEKYDGLRWLEVSSRSVRFYTTPLDVASTLNKFFSCSNQAWIFTSATLAVGEDFSHFTSRIGLSDIKGITFESPYDLKNNALIYLPPNIPLPSDQKHTTEVMQNVVPLLRLTNGGIFFLFTSHRALNLAQEWFELQSKVLKNRPLLIQGEFPRDDILRRFRDYGNAVLLGTGTFWEGVDVRGIALTIVVIDKLPFGSPADPLMMARLEYIRRQGGNGFIEHQIPSAAISLKQGAGRLLRDQADYGVIVICDPRITSKGYGSIFLDCLKPIPSTNSIKTVKNFFIKHEN